MGFKKILLVDDEEEVTRILAKRLGRRGYECATAANGQLALNAMQDTAYHIVIMDVKMPVMDGMSATREIRQQMKTGKKPLPIIAMTAVTLPETVEEIMRSGMNGHIAKPVNLAALRKTLAYWLDRS